MDSWISGFRGFLVQTILKLVVVNLTDIIFEHLTDDTASICKEKTNHGHLNRFFDDARKQLEKISQKVSSCDPF